MKRMRSEQTKALRIAAIATAGALMLGACGQSGNLPDDEPTGPDPTDAAEGDGDGDEAAEATIRFSWWGPATRHGKMEEIIDDFKAEHPNISIVPDFTDWGGYWDKLGTQTAGGDTPDVLMQEDRYLGEYASRGVLANLDDFDIDTSQIDEAVVDAGAFSGGVWGVPTGANAFTIHANPRLFDEAGVELPDDTTWTWDDYVDLSNELSMNLEDGVYGTTDYSFNEVGFMVYLRQHGQELYDESGFLGYDDALLVEWFDRALQLQESGGQVPLDEVVGNDVGETPISTNQAAMAMTWSSQLGDNAETSGDDLVLLRMPGESQFERPGMYFKPGMYVSMAATSDHPEAAAELIDYFVNSEEVGRIMLADLGMPVNATVLETVRDDLPEADQQVAELHEAVSTDIVDSPPPMPVGAGEVAGIMMRINEGVLFGQLTPEEGAAQFRAEAEAAIG